MLTTSVNKLNFWAVIGGILILSLALRGGGMTPDVSWLTDMCVRILQGQVAYVDIFETTPPIPTLLYMPAAMAEYYLNIRAENVIIAYSYGCYILVLWLTYKLLPEQIPSLGPSKWVIVLPAALFLFLLTRDAFAQRETYAAALILPILAVLIAHESTGAWPRAGLRFWAACLAGLAVAIKPPIFALPLILAGFYYIIRQQSIRPLYSGGLILAAFVCVALTAGTLVLFPAYLDGMLTLMREVYVPLRLEYSALLYSPLVVLIGCLAVILFLYFGKEKPFAIVLFTLVTAANCVIFVYQGKFFDYHAVPAALFAFLLIWMAVYSQIVKPRLLGGIWQPFSLIAMVWVLALSGYFYITFDDTRPRMDDLTWAQELNQPTAMAISPFISLGFPLAREIDAQWVDRIHSQWVAHYTRLSERQDWHSVEERRLFAQYHQSEINRIRSLIRNKQPDIIIQCRADSCRWLTQELLEGDPHLLENYTTLTEQGVFRILQRQQYPPMSMGENQSLEQ